MSSYMEGVISNPIAFLMGPMKARILSVCLSLCTAVCLALEHCLAQSRNPINTCVFFFKTLFILFFREGKGERKRGKETSMCGCSLHTPYWGPGRQPRHVP